MKHTNRLIKKMLWGSFFEKNDATFTSKPDFNLWVTLRKELEDPSFSLYKLRHDGTYSTMHAPFDPNDPLRLEDVVIYGKANVPKDVLISRRQPVLTRGRKGTKKGFRHYLTRLDYINYEIPFINPESLEERNIANITLDLIMYGSDPNSWLGMRESMGPLFKRGTFLSPEQIREVNRRRQAYRNRFDKNLKFASLYTYYPLSGTDEDGGTTHLVGHSVLKTKDPKTGKTVNITNHPTDNGNDYLVVGNNCSTSACRALQTLTLSPDINYNLVLTPNDALDYSDTIKYVGPKAKRPLNIDYYVNDNQYKETQKFPYYNKKDGYFIVNDRPITNDDNKMLVELAKIYSDKELGKDRNFFKFAKRRLKAGQDPMNIILAYYELIKKIKFTPDKRNYYSMLLAKNKFKDE